MSDDVFDKHLQAGYVLLSQARTSFDQAFQARPAVRVVKVASDEDVAVPAVEAHICTDECDDGGPDGVAVHVLNEGELERAYNSAARRLRGILFVAGRSLNFELPTYKELTDMDHSG